MTDMNETTETQTPEEEFTDFASEEFDETFEFEPAGEFDEDRPGEEDEDFGDAEHEEDPDAWEAAAPDWPLESWGKFSPRTNPTHPAVALINTALGVEGDRFTVETVSAVNAFQETKGLKPVGNVGPVTWERLFGGETDGVSE